jgi:hypothetical protein
MDEIKNSQDKQTPQLASSSCQAPFIVVRRANGQFEKGNISPTQWKPGCPAPNPYGRGANAGLTWQEWINYLGTLGTVAKVKAVLRDKKAPPAKKAAALELLQWMSTKTTKSGVPIAGESADRILDRSLGKPVQRSITADLTDNLDGARGIAALTDSARKALADALANGTLPRLEGTDSEG